MQSKSPFHSNTVFLTVYNSLLYSLHAHKNWKISVEKYRRYGTLSKTTHFLSVFREVDVAQQGTEVQAGVVQDGLKSSSVHTQFVFLRMRSK